MDIKQQQQLLRALRFATEKHKYQFRKGSSKTPFIDHPIMVANILANNGEAENWDLLQAAILHDVIEDTNTFVTELIENFGEKISNIVLECSDDKNLPSILRKKAQVDGVAKASTNAKKLKLADKIANIRDINLDPPIGWNIVRRLNYLEWANNVCCQINGVNENLETLFKIEFAKAKETLLANATMA